ncbi:MAG: universal stress protein [Bacteroidota bacterium]
MNKILVPIHPHDNYTHSIKYASFIAARTGAKLHICFLGKRREIKKQASYDFGSNIKDLLNACKDASFKQEIMNLHLGLMKQGLQVSFNFLGGRSVNEIIRETFRNSYDLIIMTHREFRGLRSLLNEARVSKVITQVNVPVFAVPMEQDFKNIEHITYAVDLTDYDPAIIQQVKSIARIFDARLSITHVNRETEIEKEKYLLTLEKTISDTLDYPKVYYKFFDHADPLKGILNFMQLNNSSMVAMISRSKFSWRRLLSPKSMTRLMSREVSVPILAFGKAKS